MLALTPSLKPHGSMSANVSGYSVVMGALHDSKMSKNLGQAWSCLSLDISASLPHLLAAPGFTRKANHPLSFERRSWKGCELATPPRE